MSENNKIPEKDHEEKTYLVCIIEENGDNYWELLTGRTDAYEFCKSCVGAIDFSRSFILVDGVKLENRKLIYDFLKYAQNFYDDNFEVDDYIYEHQYQFKNDIDDTVVINNEDRMDIHDILGNVFNN